jgi:hypothetical protein
LWSGNENTETIGVEGRVGDETTSLKAKKPDPEEEYYC